MMDDPVSSAAARPPAEDLQRLRRVLGRLVWRERALIAVEVLGRGALVFAGALVLAVLAVWARADRGVVAAALVLWLGVGAWVAVAVPALTRWRPAGDPLRQARLAEGVAPHLRGRLVTVAEHTAPGARPAGSEALLGLAARRAVAALPSGLEARIHRGLRQVVLVALALVMLALPLPLSLVAGGPGAVARWWAAGLDVAGALAVLDLGGPEQHAQVGDLVLEYTYPEYTGLDPRRVENSTGDAQGPPGTTVRVHARSAERVEAAGLVAYEQRYEAEVVGERLVSGAFTIGAEAGSYHLVTWVDGASSRSRDLQITPELDLAPEVMLDGPEDVVELALDEALDLLWRARDDHGVASVRIRLDGAPVGNALYTARERRAEAFGETRVSPAQLGLAPGAEVRLDIAATDNDTISGAKEGSSRVVLLRVLGPTGLAQRNQRLLHELTGLMLTALADHLEEPAPVSRIAGPLAAWGERVASRYTPLQEVIDRDWSSLPALEQQVLTDAITAGGELVRHTQVSYEPRASTPAPAPALAETLRLRDRAVLTLEDGILALSGLIRAEALHEVVRIAERLDRLGQELASMLAEPDPDALAMLARLEQLEAALDELMRAAAQLDEGGLQEFLNARGTETRDLMSEIREALAQGRTDEARTLMERLATQLQQMADGVQQTMNQQQASADDQLAKAQELVEELAELEQAQRALQDEIAAEQPPEDDAQAEALWQQVQAEAEALGAQLGRYRAGLAAASRPFNEQQRAEATGIGVAGLREAAGRQDLRGSRRANQAVGHGVEAMLRGWQGARLGQRALEGPGEPELDGLFKRVEAIEALLDQLDQAASSGGSSSPEQSQAQKQRQQELQERLDRAQQQGQQVSRGMDVRPGAMEERLEEARERMGEAADDLGRGQPMAAEGGQGAAADRIREAREELERAMQQSQEQRQAGSGQRDTSGQGQDRTPPREFELPTGEEFRSPEAYRRALLEGMEGEVPEEFQALKKRYFEELVRQ